MAENIGPGWAALAGRWHDFGKYWLAFQTKAKPAPSSSRNWGRFDFPLVGFLANIQEVEYFLGF